MAGPTGYAFHPQWNKEELEQRERRERERGGEEGELAEPEPEVGRLPVPAARLADTDWCECGNCEIMSTARECICCREISRCRDLQPDGCVIDNEDFARVCLTPVVLRVFNVARRDIRGHRPRERGRAPEQLDSK